MPRELLFAVECRTGKKSAMVYVMIDSTISVAKEKPSGQSKFFCMLINFVKNISTAATIAKEDLQFKEQLL